MEVLAPIIHLLFRKLSKEYEIKKLKIKIKEVLFYPEKPCE